MHGLNCFHHVWKTARREWDYKWKIKFFQQVKLFPVYSILCIINTRWMKSNLHLPWTVELLKIIWFGLWLCTLVKGRGATFVQLWQIQILTLGKWWGKTSLKVGTNIRFRLPGMWETIIHRNIFLPLISKWHLKKVNG